MLSRDHDEFFDVCNEDLRPTHSRRDMIKRFAALGLVAAGGDVLSPAVAEATGGRDGAAGRRRARRSLTAAAESKPTIAKAYLRPLERDARTGTYLVTVDYTVRFSAYDVTQMKGGLRYILECRFWDRDGTSSDDIIYAWAEKPDLPGDVARRAAPHVFPRAGAVRAEYSGSFQQRMSWTWLDQDCDNLLLCEVETFYAGLRIKSSANYGGDSTTIVKAETNKRTQRVPL